MSSGWRAEGSGILWREIHQQLQIERPPGGAPQDGGFRPVGLEISRLRLVRRYVQGHLPVARRQRRFRFPIGSAEPARAVARP